MFLITMRVSLEAIHKSRPTLRPLLLDPIQSCGSTTLLVVVVVVLCVVKGVHAPVESPVACSAVVVPEAALFAPPPPRLV